MTRSRHGRRRVRDRQVRLWAGAGVVAVLALLIYLATSAQNGLPWQSSYRLNVELPNADRLTATDQVEIAGVPVGRVASVTAVAPSGARPAYARASLALDRSVGLLPRDTRVQILSSSVLGATYVDLIPGQSRVRIAGGGTLPVARTRPTVQLTDLFDVFNRTTDSDIRSTLDEVGGGLAGRGTAVNVTLQALGQMLPKLTNVSRELAANSTQLGGFVHSYDTFAAALQPAAPQLAGLVSGGATTLGALNGVRGALGRTIDALPGTEAAATAALHDLTPSLQGLARVATGLRPGASLLPGTARTINSTLVAGIRPIDELPPFAGHLSSTLGVLRSVSALPSTDGAVRKLISLVRASNPPIDTLEQGQVYCNVITTMFLNIGGAFSYLGVGQEGPPGAVFSFTSIGAKGEVLQQGRPSSNVDINYQPTEDAQECAGGNEPADGVSQLFNNPTANVGHNHYQTTAPPASYDAARTAGLLTPPRGWHR